MIMEIIDYKDYLLIATAFQDEDGHWIGQTAFKSLEGNPIALQNAMVFDNITFDLKEDAEDFALSGGQYFVDTQLENSGLE